MISHHFTLSSIVGFVFISNVFILPTIALEPAIIQNQSSKFIVKVGGDLGGTGFFVRKNNNRYTILTNRHVIESRDNYTVTTLDGRSYNFTANNIRSFPGLDLAEIEIDSDANYQVATLTKKSTFIAGDTVYTYGWNAVGKRAKSRGLMWLRGEITGRLSASNSSDGYILAYTLTLIHGLSGSPLLNEQGEVIGVYGSGEENSIGLGIPISTYQSYINSGRVVASTPSPLPTVAKPRQLSIQQVKPPQIVNKTPAASPSEVIAIGQLNRDASRLVSERLAAEQKLNRSPVTQSVKLSSDSRFVNLPRLNGKAIIEMKIANRGTIMIEVDGDNAPITAGNFVDLVQRGFYNGLTFHRVVRSPKPFVVQGGDPKGNGSSGYIPTGSNIERRIPLEILPDGAAEAVYSQTIPDMPRLQHMRGSIAMARSQSPDSASSQFYFTLDKISFLDGNYAVFGQITQGLEVMDAIQQGDKILSATVTQSLGSVQLP
jgi:peptidyl-prolyl cis-trans isomerase B (cyclophilin B)